MIFIYRKWLSRIRFVLLFMLLTYLLYHVILVWSDIIQPTDRYKTPAGKSVKAFHQHTVNIDKGSISDRLRLFYWYGE
ncbi:hypothetical protein D3C73_778240 [compost metagenome]